MEYKVSTYSVFLVLVLFCSSVFSAGIELQKRNSTNTRIYAYVGSAAYQNISSNLMIAEVRGTFDLLREKLKREGMNETGWPSVVSALSTGDGKIYFGSSMKGPGEVPGTVATAFGLDQRVITALNACTQDTTNGTGKHRYQGKCGEINVISRWYELNGAKALPATGKLVVAYNGGVCPPCSTPVNPPSNNFGCRQFLTKLGFNASEIIRRESVLEGTEVMQNVLGVTQDADECSI